MQIFQSVAQLLRPGQHTILRQKTGGAFQYLQQRLSINEFHDHVLPAALFENIGYPGQVRMIQSSQQFGFALKSGDCLRSLRCGNVRQAHLFQRPDFIGQTLVAHPVYCAHAALSDSLQNYVAFVQDGIGRQATGDRKWHSLPARGDGGHRGLHRHAESCPADFAEAGSGAVRLATGRADDRGRQRRTAMAAPSGRRAVIPATGRAFPRPKGSATTTAHFGSGTISCPAGRTQAAGRQQRTTVATKMGSISVQRATLWTADHVNLSSPACSRRGSKPGATDWTGKYSSPARSGQWNDSSKRSRHC